MVYVLYLYQVAVYLRNGIAKVFLQMTYIFVIFNADDDSNK
jgi:hypothetical protein